MAPADVTLLLEALARLGERLARAQEQLDDRGLRFDGRCALASLTLDLAELDVVTITAQIERAAAVPQ